MKTLLEKPILRDAQIKIELMKDLLQEIKAVEDYYNISLSKNKKQENVYFRFAIMSRHKVLGVATLGKLLNKNHSTVIYALQKAEQLEKWNDEHYVSIRDLSLNFDARKLAEIRKEILNKKARYIKKDVKIHVEKIRVEKIRVDVKMNEVISVLKNYPKSNLWNKQISSWSEIDVSNYKRMAMKL